MFAFYKKNVLSSRHYLAFTAIAVPRFYTNMYFADRSSFTAKTKQKLKMNIKITQKTSISICIFDINIWCTQNCPSLKKKAIIQP